MTMQVRWVYASIALYLLSGFQANGQPPKKGKPPVSANGLTTAQMKSLQRHVDQTIREAGVVVSAAVTDIHSEAPGEAIVLFVAPEGEVVKKGDLLLRFDDAQLLQAVREQEVAVQQAQAAVRTAEAGVESAKSQAALTVPAAEAKLQVATLARTHYSAEGGTFETELASADRKVAIAQARLELSERRLPAADENGVKELELDALELAVAEAKSELETVSAAKKLLTQYTRGHQTALLDLAVLEAQANLKQAQSALVTSKRTAESELQICQTMLHAHQTRLAEIQQQVEQCRIVAPRDGVVTYATSAARRTPTANLEAGATVRQGQLLLQIADLEQLQVRARIHESRISRVQVGQTVTLTLDAFPTQSFAGKVSAINRTPEPAQWFNQSGAEYGVIVNLETPPQGIRIGMTTLAEIDTASKNKRPE